MSRRRRRRLHADAEQFRADPGCSVALEKQPYDPAEGFIQIALIGRAPCVLMANPAELQAFSAFDAMQK